MVEGAVVASVFVILFACLWAALSYHANKIRVMESARSEAWPAALDACPGDGNAFVDVGDHVNPHVADDYADLDKSSLAVESGHVKVERLKAVTFPGVIGGTTVTMKGRMFLRCNEPKSPETAGQFFKQGFAVLLATSGL
jgi:hypothetical protein